MRYSIHQFLSVRTLMFMMLFLCSGWCVAGVKIVNLRCEYNNEPVGVATQTPRFTWTYSGNNANFKQKRVLLSVSTDKKLLKQQICQTENTDNSLIVYSGKESLKPHTRYYWKVTVLDANSKKLNSAVSTFMTAKLSEDDWSAQWISDTMDKDAAPSPMLRKSFVTSRKKMMGAYLYVSAAGYFNVAVNGKWVNRSYLSPGYTHYDKRNLYLTYDVTKNLEKGENVISAVLGNGFYNEIQPVTVWTFENARWRGRARMICELHINYSDGSTQVINSDESWKTATGPFLHNNIYSGDAYDATREIPGWDKPGFDDSRWAQAVRVPAPSPVLTAQNMPEIKVEKEIMPVAVKSFGDTVFVYDFGINHTGFTCLTVKGEKGAKLRIRHGELLTSDGHLQTGNIDVYYKREYPGYPFQTDLYELSGRQETLSPNFCYHGYRYAEVHCDRPMKLSKENLKSYFFHTAVQPVGHFSCSNEMLNNLWTITRRSYLCNLMSIPTDCPQREKNGWTADAHISQDLGLLNFDGITFYEKWIDDMVDNQTAEGRVSGIIPSSGWGYDDWIGPVWDAALFIIPMNLYRYYGDVNGIRKIWPVCKKYLEYLKTRENENKTVVYGIGDWVPFKTTTPTDFTTTCFYYMDNEYMARFAEKLGEDGSAYAAKAAELKAFINQHYFDSEKSTYANGSEAALGVALYLGLVPQENEQQVADKLCRLVEESNNHLDFGMLGSKTVLRMLVKYGHADVAYKMATQTDSPSWGDWLKKGLTTPPETWVLSPDFRDASLNHVFLGDINAWMYNDLAGINYDENNPGFSHFFITPHFVKDLNWVKADYQSVKGLIRSEWQRNSAGITLKVTVPANTSATVIVDGKSTELLSGEHQLSFK